MNKLATSILSVLMLLVVVNSANAQSKRYTAVFYNIENVFDTINDPTINDEEFLPDGIKNWTGVKYWKKMANIERALFNLSSECKAFPTVIGVSEIENRNVLEDIASMPKLAPAGYQIVHYDGPDARGVDCAFFYRPDQFTLTGSSSERVVVEGQPDFRTRDILTMTGTIDGEEFLFIVSHWPSRRNGQAASSHLRETVAAQIRGIIDAHRAKNPNIKAVVMGDFNDDPKDKSVSEILGGKRRIKDLEEGDMFNPFYQMHQDGHGSLAYQDAWNLFDNIVVTENLATDGKGKLHLVSASKSKYLGNIFNRPFLIQQEGQYRGYPLRTYVGNAFQDGYSDHLPVFIFFEK